MTRRNLLQSLASAAALGPALGPALGASAENLPASTVYELRVYHMNEGKLPLILERFRSKETKIFTRLGMHNVAFWVPTADPGNAIGPNTLVYIVRHASREAARASWEAFGKDPEWIALKAESEKDGAFLARHESTFLQLTDFSPQL
jgi:hypothetical protein